MLSGAALMAFCASQEASPSHVVEAIQGATMAPLHGDVLTPQSEGEMAAYFDAKMAIFLKMHQDSSEYRGMMQSWVDRRAAGGESGPL